MNNLAEILANEKEIWAIVTPDGPAWTVAKDADEAWARFVTLRDELGVNPRLPESDFKAVKISWKSALGVLEGNPDAWEAVDA